MHAALKWSLPFVFALLFWASFHPLNLGFLGWVALVPLVVYARQASGKKSFFVAWLGGAVAFAACFFWVRHTVAIGPYLLGIYNGLYVALFVVLVRRLGVAWAPVAWTALEFFRGFFLSGLPWFLLGYTQHELLHLIQIADLGGVWLVSALVAWVNAVLVEGRRPLRVAAAAALAAAFVYGAVRLPSIRLSEGPRIAVIQPNIPQDIKEVMYRRPEEAVRIYQKHLELTHRAAQEEPKPELIVWPEAAVYNGLLWMVRDRAWVTRDRWYARVRAPAEETGVPVLMGLLVAEFPEELDWPTADYTNSAVLVEPEKGIVARYDKVHLVPFAEYFPFGTVGLVKKISDLYLADMRPGTDFPVWGEGAGRYGVQICFEGIFPEISREIARKGAAFTVNISNDGWFRASAELDQMLAMARFRAIESRMHFIRATNTGISAFIEPTGRVQKLLPGKEVEGILADRIKVTGAGSLYRAVGDAAGWLALLALGAGSGRRFFVDRKRRRGIE